MGNSVNLTLAWDNFKVFLKQLSFFVDGLLYTHTRQKVERPSLLVFKRCYRGMRNHN